MKIKTKTSAGRRPRFQESHSITLNLTKPQLDVLLARIEMAATMQLRGRTLRGPKLFKDALVSLDNENAYDLVQLTPIYLELVRHWKSRRTQAGMTFENEYQKAYAERHWSKLEAMANRIAV